MTDYDSMSVHDLIGEIMELEARHYSHSEDYGDKELAAIESALRKAVIREASVGEVYVARDYTDGCPEFRFKCPESLTGEVKGQHICKLCGELMPERQYLLIPGNLIPKETP